MPISFYPAVAQINNEAEIPVNEEVDALCDRIVKACKGFGTDEDTLTSTLGSLTSTGRYLVSKRFPHFNEGQSLEAEIQSETSGDYKKLLELIAVPLDVVEARLIRKATKGMGTDEKALYPLLVARSNEDLDVLKKTYFKLYDEDLNVLVHKECGGKLGKFLQESLEELIPEYDADIYTPEKALADAHAYYEAGEGKWGTDEKSMFRLICRSPSEHLVAVDTAYTKLHGNNMLKAAEKELGGTCEDAVVFALGMHLMPHDTVAQLIESACKGLGTDEDKLMMCIARFHQIMPEVRQAYHDRYGKSLHDRVAGETSGDFKKLLLEMIDVKT